MSDRSNFNNSPASDSANNCPPLDDDTIHRALTALAHRYAGDLVQLVSDARRASHLAAQLPPDEAAAAARSHVRALADSALEILTAWQAIGGHLVFEPPTAPLGDRPLTMPILLGAPSGFDTRKNGSPSPALAATAWPAVPLVPAAVTPEAGLPTPPSPIERGPQAAGAPDPATTISTPTRLPPPNAAPHPVGHGAPGSGRNDRLSSPPRHLTPDMNAIDLLQHGAEPPDEPVAPVEDWVADLAVLLADIPFSDNLQEELETIQRSANLSFSRWPNYPRAVQRALVGNLACRLRHLQDHLRLSGPKMDAAFRSLTRYSKSYQPGWVNGLTRGRGPAADSWTDEARCWWDQLLATAGGLGDALWDPSEEDLPTTLEAHLDKIRRWLGEWRSAPDVAKPMCLEKTMEAIRTARAHGLPVTHPALCRLAGEIYDYLEVPTFMRLRQAIRDLEMAEQEDQGGHAHDEIPSDWLWWSHTVGRRSIFIGKTASDGQRAALEKAFGLATLLWETPSSSQDELPAVSERIMNGQTDLVVLLGHADHHALNQRIIRCAQEAGIAWVMVAESLGTTRVRIAIERFLQPDLAGLQR